MSDVPDGKRRGERKVDVPHAPPNVLAELMARPAKNSQTITGIVPGPDGSKPTIQIPAAPVVVDVRRVGPMARADDSGIIQP
jgi:hypothetical protein